MQNLINMWKGTTLFPIIYNRRNVDIGKIMKDEYFHLQTVIKILLLRAQLLHIEKIQASLIF